MSRLTPNNQLALARSLSEFGNALRLMALPIGILRVSNNPQYIAVAELSESIMAVLSGILIPVFIDKVPRIHALLASDLFSLFCTLSLGIGLYLESLPLLIFVSAMMAGSYVLHEASLSAATSELDTNGETQSIIKGFSKLQLLTLLMGIAGALSGSSLISRIPIWTFFVIDAVSFVLSSVWIFFLVKPMATNQTFSKNKIQLSVKQVWEDSISEWALGFKYCLKNKTLLRLIASQSFVAIGHGLLAGTIIGHYKTRLMISDGQVGHAQINNRVWQVLGAIVRVRLTASPGTVMLGATLLMTLGYFGMFGSHGFLFFLLFYGLQQFGNSLLTPTNRALCMTNAQPEIRGRVAAFRGLAIDIGILTGNALAILILSVSFSEYGYFAAGVFLLFSALVGFVTPTNRQAI